MADFIDPSSIASTGAIGTPTTAVVVSGATIASTLSIGAPSLRDPENTTHTGVAEIDAGCSNSSAPMSTACSNSSALISSASSNSSAPISAACSTSTASLG